MRKPEQNKILEVMATLNEAADEIKRFHKKKKADDMTALLSECQYAVTELGAFIEKLAGEGTATVTGLEECHELMYELGVNADKASAGDVKRLKRKLFNLENTIKDELRPDRLEIAFFPYKASMWDAFESVWRAARNDPKCDAYVVPIPYYDKINGQLGEMHYEGGDYPEYVPVTDWRQYNHTERRPDVIFIHNPYDEYNTVTSVHPDYYSHRLRGATDLLVYIPYYVTNKAYAHHVTVTGAIYAHKVIVQSESLRAEYIQQYREFCGQNGIGDAYGKPEDKIVALGSPKMDMVINAKREDFTLPEEWQRLIQKPDGGRKAVILYNTTISTLLSGNRAILYKLRYVFDKFKKRDDVVLWWRPHPLSKTTYESMRPQLLEEYNGLVEEYRQEAFGIYDDTPDSQRAMCFADALYGEGGSLFTLFMLTGKPVMRQESKINGLEGWHDPYTFNSIVEAGRSYWACLMYSNILLELDKETCEVIRAVDLPNPNNRRELQYRGVVPVGDELALVPRDSDNIAFFNPQTGNIRELPLPTENLYNYDKSHQEIKFSNIYDNGDGLFFAPAGFPAVVRYSKSDGEITCFDDWARDFPAGHYFLYSAPVDKGFVVFGELSNAVVYFDMESCQSEIWHIGKPSYAYTAAHFDGKYLWLVQKNPNPVLVRWDRETQETLEIPVTVPGFVGGMCTSVNIVGQDGKLWLIPLFANMAICFDTVSMKMEPVEGLSREYSPEMPYSVSFHAVTLWGDILVLKAFCRSALIEFNLKTRELTEKKNCLTDEQKEIILAAMSKGDKDKPKLYRQYFIGETAPRDLDVFLNNAKESQGEPYEKQMAYYRGKIANGDGKAGEAIYQMCKREAGL